MWITIGLVIIIGAVAFGVIRAKIKGKSSCSGCAGCDKCIDARVR
jgi:hypothetical protein